MAGLSEGNGRFAKVIDNQEVEMGKCSLEK